MGLRLRHNVDRVFQNTRWKRKFKIYQASRVPNDKGRAEIMETVVEAVGEIQPTDGDDLDRLPEGDRGKESITVWTPTPLTNGTDTRLPDEIEWRGVRYLVRILRDWKDYGRGFCRAICVAQDMAGIAGDDSDDDQGGGSP